MSTTPPPVTPPPPETQAPPPDEGSSEGQRRGVIIGASIAGLVIVAALALGAYYLVSHPAQASAWRDVFIVFMALEFMVIGVALVVLVVQLAVLTNLLRNEVKPILEATQETLNTVRGTTEFVSENVVEPIIKLNSYVASLQSVLQTLSLFTGLRRDRR